MSKQALVEFMQTAAADESVLAEIFQMTGASDFVALAKRKGFELGDLTADEIQRMLASIMGLGATQELTDEELDMVSAAGLSKLQQAGASLKPGGDGDKSALLIHSDSQAKTPFILEVTSRLEGTRVVSASEAKQRACLPAWTLHADRNADDCRNRPAPARPTDA